MPVELAVFDDSVGRLRRGAEIVGYVSFRLDWMSLQRGGHLWWRTFGEPYRVVFWLETLWPGTPGQSVDDGILRGDAIAGAGDEIRAGVWTICSAVGDGSGGGSTVERGPSACELEMLAGDDRADSWANYGWGTALGA